MQRTVAAAVAPVPRTVAAAVAPAPKALAVALRQGGPRPAAPPPDLDPVPNLDQVQRDLEAALAHIDQAMAFLEPDT